MGHFVTLNRERIVDPAIIKRVAAAVREETAPAMVVTTFETPREYRVITSGGDNISNIEEKPDGPVAMNQINAGIYGFHRLFPRRSEQHTPVAS